MRTFAVGDIHGAHKALLQVLDRSGFDPENDRLISLGDVTDYHPESAQVVEELLSIRNLVAVKGNHDIWAGNFLINRKNDPSWVAQGGKATILSYMATSRYDDPRHKNFFRDQVLYFVDEANRLYVHAGFDRNRPIQVQNVITLCWDRKFIEEAGRLWMAGEELPEYGYENIFVGHTPTPTYFHHTNPVSFGPVWNLDQGAKRGGRLTIMDVETKEYWQSDLVSELYP